jgi:nucleoside phosphorylase
MSSNFEEMKVSGLKQYCKENGIKCISGLKKSDIINNINNNKKMKYNIFLNIITHIQRL